MPNCRAIFDGVTPALKAARTAFSLPGVNEAAASSTRRLKDVSSWIGGFLPRHISSANDAAANRSSSWSSRCLIAAGKSLGRALGRESADAAEWFGAGVVGRLAAGGDGSRVAAAEKRSGVVE